MIPFVQEKYELIYTLTYAKNVSKTTYKKMLFYILVNGSDQMEKTMFMFIFTI